MRFESDYAFRAKVWVYASERGTWYLIDVPKKHSKHIKDTAPKTTRRGWGSVRVKAAIGTTQWQTSIFPSKEGHYVMLLKAEVRAKEHIREGSMVQLTLTIGVDL